MKSKSLTMRGMLLTALLCCGQTACTKTMASSAPTSFCLIAKPIYWSGQDTPSTALAAKEHNAVGKALCGWGTKPAG